MDAKSLVGAMIARHVEEHMVITTAAGGRGGADRRHNGRMDVLIWAAQLAYGWDEVTAETHVAEEIQEHLASMG